MLLLLFLFHFIFCETSYKKLRFTSARLEVVSDENLADYDLIGLSVETGDGGAMKITGGTNTFQSFYFLKCNSVYNCFLLFELFFHFRKQGMEELFISQVKQHQLLFQIQYLKITKLE
jgi:hypothetical protein